MSAVSPRRHGESWSSCSIGLVHPWLTCRVPDDCGHTCCESLVALQAVSSRAFPFSWFGGRHQGSMRHDFQDASTSSACVVYHRWCRFACSAGRMMLAESVGRDAGVTTTTFYEKCFMFGSQDDRRTLIRRVKFLACLPFGNFEVAVAHFPKRRGQLGRSARFREPQCNWARSQARGARRRDFVFASCSNVEVTFRPPTRTHDVEPRERLPSNALLFHTARKGRRTLQEEFHSTALMIVCTSLGCVLLAFWRPHSHTFESRSERLSAVSTVVGTNLILIIWVSSALARRSRACRARRDVTSCATERSNEGFRPQLPGSTAWRSSWAEWRLHT